MQRIIVSSTKDIKADKNGIGTFRKAIQTVNEYYNSNPDKLNEPYYIDFEAEFEPTQTWIIKPDIPLPPILKGNVHINSTEPKFLIFSGEQLANTRPSKVPGWVKEPKGPKQNQHSSLLTLGDSKYLEATKNSPGFEDISSALFTLHSVNFSSNKAKGGDGERGSGGGLGAGGGLSVVSGTTHIKDSVFQKLQAIGGAGGSGQNHGGKSTSGRLSDGKKGEKGGTGGLRGSFTINTSDTFQVCPGGTGGARGNQDIGWKLRNKKSPKEIQSIHPGLAGGPGGAGTNCSKSLNSFGFGHGGGSGGGGGGGSNYIGVFVTSNGGDGGRGGNGGAGGFGAGGGGGGGGGTPWKGGEQDQGNHGWDWGNPGSGALGGLFATSGSKGKIQKSGGSHLSSLEIAGGKGGNGAALGGAIAVLSDHAKLELTNVDFIGNEAETSGGSRRFNTIFSLKNTKGQVKGHDIRLYQNSNSDDFSRPKFNSQLINEDFHTFIESKAGPDETILDGHHSATSYPRSDDLAKIRNKIINLESGKNETLTIKFERPKSGLIEINVNQDQLLAELNGIHKQIIPVEKKETIEARHQKKLISALFQTGGDLLGIGNPLDLFSASSGNYTKKDLATGVAGKVVGAAANFAFSAINAKKTLDKEIEKNNANIKKLAEKTNPKRELLEIAPIDISRARTLIKIDNFTIGEDILLLEDFGKKLNPNSEGINGPTIRNGASKTRNGEIVESFEIHLDNTKNDNVQTKIATISLDPASTKDLNEPVQRDPASYLTSLLYYDNDLNRWVLGKTLFRPTRAIHSGPTYTGGPAGELVILERDSSFLNSEIATLRTKKMDDIVFGSPGNEVILTDAGWDQITPNLGNDTINAGAGFDKIDFQDIKQPINVLGSKFNENNSDVVHPKIQVTYRHPDENISKTLDSTSLNTEAIAAWGSSKINLSNIADPNDFIIVNNQEEIKEPGYYGIRTGLGSNVQGSPHSDRVIISLMKDENDGKYLDVNKNCKISLDERPLKILAKPAIVNGGGGDDKLTFLFDSIYPRGYLEIHHEDKFFGWVGRNGIPSNGNPVINISAITNPDSEKNHHGVSDYYLTEYTGDNKTWESENSTRLINFSGDVEWSILEENELKGSGVDDFIIENKMLSHKKFFKILEDTPRSFTVGLNFKADSENPKFLSDISGSYGIRIEAKSKDSDSKAYFNVFFNVLNKDKSKWPNHLSGLDVEERFGVDNEEFRFGEDNKEFDYTYNHLTITDLENAPAGLQGFKAVIKNDTVIAFVKDIDISSAFASRERDIGTAANVEAANEVDSMFTFTEDGALEYPIHHLKDNPLDLGNLGNLTDSDCELEKPLMHDEKSQALLIEEPSQFEVPLAFVTAEEFFFNEQVDINEPENTNPLGNDQVDINEPENTNIIDELPTSTLNTIRNSSHSSGKKAGKEKVKGTNEADVLLSGLGKDKLAGKKDGDIFWIKETEEFQKSGVDQIIGFDTSEGDVILIGGSDQWSSLGTSATYSSANSKKQLKQASKSDIDIIYFQKGPKGLLFYNENATSSGYGDGGLFLNLKGGPDITSSDIQIINEI